MPGNGPLALALVGLALSFEGDEPAHGRGPTDAVERILEAPPRSIDPDATYLFYLHGRIVQEQGRGAVSAEYGPYEYDGIVRRFASDGLVVISEVRPRGTEVSAYAERVAAQIGRLLAAGVPARRITVVGASMGGGIALEVSSRLDARGVGYVIMGACSAETMARHEEGLHGDVLSIFEASDPGDQSCAPLLERSRSQGEHHEIRLETGLRHGFLYRPLHAWMAPAIGWARERRVTPRPPNADPRAARESPGRICVAKLPENAAAIDRDPARRRRRRDYTYEFSVRVDEGEWIDVPAERGVLIRGLPTGRGHVVTIRDGEREIESIPFTFEAKGGDGLCLSYTPWYQTWRLEVPAPKAWWCRCDEEAGR